MDQLNKIESRKNHTKIRRICKTYLSKKNNLKDKKIDNFLWYVETILLEKYSNTLTFNAQLS